jgi:hypothetical protein
MEIGEFVTFVLDRLTQIVRHTRVKVHIEKDRASVAD